MGKKAAESNPVTAGIDEVVKDGDTVVIGVFQGLNEVGRGFAKGFGRLTFAPFAGSQTLGTAKLDEYK